MSLIDWTFPFLLLESHVTFAFISPWFPFFRVAASRFCICLSVCLSVCSILVLLARCLEEKSRLFQTVRNRVSTSLLARPSSVRVTHFTVRASRFQEQLTPQQLKTIIDLAAIFGSAPFLFHERRVLLRGYSYVWYGQKQPKTCQE